MENLLESVVSCLTLLVRENWKSSSNRVSWADGSHQSQLLSMIGWQIIWEVSSEALPARHRVR